MIERHALVAFCMLMLAICYLATVAAVLAWAGKYVEALGFGGLTTGLVGVLGTFRPKNSNLNIDNAGSSEAANERTTQ